MKIKTEVTMLQYYVALHYVTLYYNIILHDDIVSYDILLHHITSLRISQINHNL